jgi:hypothetical protein
VAVQELESELSSRELADLITIEDIPPEDAVLESLRPLLEDASETDPDFAATIGNLTVVEMIRGRRRDLARSFGERSPSRKPRVLEAARLVVFLVRIAEPGILVDPA